MEDYGGLGLGKATGYVGGVEDVAAVVGYAAVAGQGVHGGVTREHGDIGLGVLAAELRYYVASVVAAAAGY